jgi:hypothetical protein
MCPLCVAIAAETEPELLSHLLSHHPLALALAVGCLAVANIALAGRPRDLLLVDAAVLGGAVLLVRGFEE